MSGVPADDTYQDYSVEENVSILALFRSFQGNTLLYGKKVAKHYPIEISLKNTSSMTTEQLMAESYRCQPKEP